MPRTKPILFSGPMIRALLDGRKRQTRRVLKVSPTKKPGSIDDYMIDRVNIGPLPYKTGDLLWVRERWSDELLAPGEVYYYATALEDGLRADEVAEIRWRPSIHMPRWASRITLEVTAVRVQRLREISWKDAEAEGCRGCLGPNPDFPDEWDPTPIEEFRDLWNALNAKPKPIYSEGRIVSYVSYPWDGESRVETYRGLPHEIRPNPFVIATTFVVHQMNIDEFLAQREVA